MEQQSKWMEIVGYNWTRGEREQIVFKERESLVGEFAENKTEESRIGVKLNVLTD